jgi:hypothetical protein
MPKTTFVSALAMLIGVTITIAAIVVFSRSDVGHQIGPAPPLTLPNSDEIFGRTTEMRSSRWIAGKTKDCEFNDIWIEVRSQDLQNITIYRDLNGDGIIDDCLTIVGNPIISIMRDENSSGHMNYEKDIRIPFSKATMIEPNTPEWRTIKGTELDENYRRFPYRPTKGR